MLNNLFKNADDHVVDQLRDDLAIAEAQSETSAAKCSQAEAHAADLNVALHAAQDRIASLEAVAAKVPALEAQASPEAISKAASIQLAAQGVPPVALEGGGEETNVWDQYKAITDPGRRNSFWKKNESRLRAATR